MVVIVVIALTPIERSGCIVNKYVKASSLQDDMGDYAVHLYTSSIVCAFLLPFLAIPSIVATLTSAAKVRVLNADLEKPVMTDILARKTGRGHRHFIHLPFHQPVAPKTKTVPDDQVAYETCGKVGLVCYCVAFCVHSVYTHNLSFQSKSSAVEKAPTPSFSIE